jgi:hypothetical protein
MWIIYAAAYYHTGHMLWPVVSNSYGAVCSSIVFGIYLRYCSPELRRRWLPSLLLFLPVALAGIVIFTLEYPLVLEAYSLFLLAVNLVMYSGPLAGIKRALEAKSVEFLPLSLGLSTIVCASPWLVFGLAIWNINFWVPNLFGVTCGTIQVCVWFYLSYSKGRDDPSKTDEVDLESKTTTGSSNEVKASQI